MQKQDIAQAIYQTTQQLPVEDWEEVFQFVEFVQSKQRNITGSPAIRMVGAALAAKLVIAAKAAPTAYLCLSL
jgi:hypothetical protein